MRRRLRTWSLAGLITVGVMVAFGASDAAGQGVRAHAAYTRECSDSRYSPNRDPSNPLELASRPGANPLTGAHFFTDGPAHGAAAGAIARLLGIDPAIYPDDYSWAQFQQDLSPGGLLYPLLIADPVVAQKVALLETIAGQEETQNVSLYAQGGGPGQIFGEVQKILCRNMTADPNPAAVPVFSTFFIYPSGQFCPPLDKLLRNWSTFKRQIDELAAGVRRHPAVFLVEIDAVGTSVCLSRVELTQWEADLRYEIEKLTALPHTVVYLEGGAADEDSPQYVARVISEVCLVKSRGKTVNVCAGMRGFWVNGTHFDWTINEIQWASVVVGLLQRRIRDASGTRYTAHFVVNTAQNGQGPLLNPHPKKQGIEYLCNPSGRGLGRAPTAATNPTYDGRKFSLTDAFLWTGTPGRSHNSDCYPGAAPAGVFDLSFALELAAHVSDQLGALAPPVPPPVLGTSFDVKLLSGVVLVKVPGGAAADSPSAHSAQLSKGQGFIPLTQARSIPVGSELDARAGVIQLIAAPASRHGKLQTGKFGGGLFRLSQDKRGVRKGLTTVTLLEAIFPGAPTYASCKAKTAADSSIQSAFGARGSTVLQTLQSSAHGRFRTRGRYAAATVRGTAWTMTERCDGTLTVVRRGTVTVRDFVRHVNVIVRAGHSYLARARGVHR